MFQHTDYFDTCSTLLNKLWYGIIYHIYIMIVVLFGLQFNPVKSDFTE